MLVQSLWKIFALILALVLMLVIPMVHAFEIEDRQVRLNLLDNLDFFLDEVSQTGEISKEGYLNFQNRINALGYPFEINIKHYKKIYVPVYEDPSLPSSFSGKIKVVEELFTNRDIKNTLFPKEEGISGESYKMSKGDYVVISVKTDVKTKYQKIREMLFMISPKTELLAKLGGVIKNEAY